MKKAVCGIVIFLLLLSSACAEETLMLLSPEESGLFYKNPNEDIAILGVDVADPSIFVDDDGIYYCYPSSGAIEGFMVWSSTDMVSWQGHGYCFKRTEDHWATGDYWAPGITKHDGVYYLAYSARDRITNLMRICIASSPSPLGPFVDIPDSSPLGGFSQLKNNTIDAELFFDDDDTPYLFYSNDWRQVDNTGNRISECYVTQLNAALTAVEGTPALVATPQDAWDTLRSPQVDELCIYNEGPCVLKHSGRYYVFFSGNHFDERQYSIGYAVADSPLGPYTKYEDNPVLYTEDAWEDISGTGHCGITQTADGKEYFMMYHRHFSAILRGGDRIMAIDRMGFREDGSVYVCGPTQSWQPLPSGDGAIGNIAGRAALTSDTMDEAALKLLTDGEFTLHTKFRRYEADLPQNASCTLAFAFDAPCSVSAVMVYSSADPSLGLSGCTVQVGDTSPEKMEITYDYNGQGILCFQPVECDRVTITIDPGDCLGSAAAISEVVILGQ